MVLQILKGTPTWVFALFLALLAIGFAQSRPRSVGLWRLSLLPGAFIAFSLYGVIAAFGAQPAELACWASGIAAAVLAGRTLAPGSGARWDAAAGRFQVPGSWAPLALMMAVFFTRYAIAASMAMHPGLAKQAAFTAAASLAYGLLSGTFLARALKVLALRPAASGHSVQSS